MEGIQATVKSARELTPQVCVGVTSGTVCVYLCVCVCISEHNILLLHILARQSLRISYIADQVSSRNSTHVYRPIYTHSCYTHWAFYQFILAYRCIVSSYMNTTPSTLSTNGTRPTWDQLFILSTTVTLTDLYVPCF